MSRELDIPPEIVARVVAKWAAASRVGVADMDDDWAERTVEQALRKGFDWLSERCRADERRKVIAELKPWLQHDGNCARRFSIPGTAGTCTCLLDATLASLLAPDAGMPNMQGDGPGPQSQQTEAASPSPEQAREGDDVPTYEMGAAGARFVTAEDEPWVNAIIEIAVPLDGVSVDDERGVKQDAVGELHAELADVLPDSFAQCVSASHWEDVRPHEEGSANG